MFCTVFGATKISLAGIVEHKLGAELVGWGNVNHPSLTDVVVSIDLTPLAEANASGDPGPVEISPILRSPFNLLVRLDKLADYSHKIGEAGNLGRLRANVRHLRLESVDERLGIVASQSLRFAFQ